MAEAWNVEIQLLQQLKVLFLCNIFVHTSTDPQRRVSCLYLSIVIHSFVQPSLSTLYPAYW